MAADDPDRLSQLPDELLQHILHLAPCREAASTALLSRRWRGLWPPPTCAVVKIDIPYSYKSDLVNPHDALLHCAEEALDAARGPIERLAINLGEYYQINDIVGDVLSHAACRGVQDIRIGDDTSGNDDDGSFSRMQSRSVGVFEFSFRVVMPSAASLRVLHITNCCDLTPPPPASTFPCLEVLRLRRCKVSLGCLQDMVVAAPELATLQLEYVFLSTAVSLPRPATAEQEYYEWELPKDYYPQSLCCPGVTTLVLVNCCCEYEDVAIELNVPRFKYRGNISQFTLSSPLPAVRSAYLHFHACNCSRDVATCESFWNFLKNFSDTNVLKLKLDWPIDCVAAGENWTSQSITFCAEHLEIDAPYNPESKDVGVAIGNLLHCCPALHGLRLKLNTADQHSRRRNGSTSQKSKAQLEFQKSIDYFRRRRDQSVVPFCGDDGKPEISDIRGLSDSWEHFKCLQFHLKRLSLQFHMDKDNANCIGIRLYRFFIEKGMALEELYIDSGIMRLWEHMNSKIGRYAANHQPFAAYDIVAAISQALSMNQFSSPMISGFHPHKLEVRRKKPVERK